MVIAALPRRIRPINSSFSRPVISRRTKHLDRSAALACSRMLQMRMANGGGPGMPSSTTTTNARPVGLSVVVPCYNEEHSLTELYRRVSAACRVRMGNDYELVLVNDGSKDATWSIIRTIALDDLHIVAVNLSRNHGHQLALSAGLSVCQ